MHRVLPALFIALFVSSAGAETKFAANRVDNAASFLAGLPPQHPGDEALFESILWKGHQQQLTTQWDQYRKATLDKLSAWAEKEVTPFAKKEKVVRYMFSGPDILHALQTFPEAESYILCGLEVVGEVPNLKSLDAGQLSNGLSEIRNALGEILEFSFFRTNDMKEDLKQSVFPGTVPIMLLFLAANDQAVTGIDFLQLAKDGSVTSLGGEAKGAKAVRIEFHPRGKPGMKRSLSYFSTNIADGEIDKSGFLKYLEQQPQGASYVKAASYLMHNTYFSSVRNHLLSNSKVLVQDDSGIPYRYFDHAKWDIKLYGVYVAPIDLFATRWQQDLNNAYLAGQKPIDFGIGYNWRKGRSNVMLAVRK